MKQKQCVIPNYIPYRNQKNSFRKWFRRYRMDVIHLYDIFHKIESDRYTDTYVIPIESDIIKFGFFLYKSSSKHIQD